VIVAGDKSQCPLSNPSKAGRHVDFRGFHEYCSDDRSQVHQIQSGQVISDGLTSAVKELVENSLDAHATSIGQKPYIHRAHFKY